MSAPRPAFTPITVPDSRTFLLWGLEYRQTKPGNGSPRIQVEHRRPGSQWWDIAPALDCHDAKAWDLITRCGAQLA